MAENKILRVVGMASSIHLDKNDGLAPVNRRISIIVLNESEMANILHEYEGAVPITDLQQLKQLPAPHTETPAPHTETPAPPEILPEKVPEPAAPDQTPPQNSAAAADTTQ